MSVFHNNALIGASGQAGAGPSVYSIERSLRFNSSDSAYCSFTPASAGNRKTWTWAGWVKKARVADEKIFAGGTSIGATTFLQIFFGSTGTLRVSSGSNDWVETAQVFRDSSAWYHFVVALDTTQVTGTNRLKLYVNGVEITTFSTDNRAANISQNTDYGININAAHHIGSFQGSSGFFSGYLADIHFIDGQALDPTSFGEFDATTGVWVPKAFTGTYGTNGFHLEFADNSSNTATTLGKDTSPNGNNWTPNNLSVTAGAGNDSLVDVPTNGAQTDTGAGGEVRGNYATLNPLLPTLTPTNGNLDTPNSAGQNYSTIAVATGKWYIESTVGPITTVTACGLGVHFNPSSAAGADYYDSGAYIGLLYSDRLARYEGVNSAVNSSVTATSGDILAIAVDLDSGTQTISYYLNNSLVTSSNLPSGKTWFVTTRQNNNQSLNFGQRSFAYTAPSGFKALNTANLPAPVVTKPSTFFDTKLYTGNGSTQTISGFGFSPDLVWIKSRSTGQDNNVFDAVRGVAGNYYALQTNATTAEGQYGTVSALTSDGFTLSNGGGATNFLNTTYVAWTWDAGTTTTTNTVGSISSQVRANATAGFSIVGWTSNGTAGIETMGHGLGVEPDLIIVKNRDATSEWQVFHSSFSNTASDYLYLNQTAAKATSGATIWTRSSTTFGFRQSSLFTNGQKAIAMLFSKVSGYSSFGSYTGNGSADGPFVYLGFRPALVIVKMSSSTGNWTMLDAKREGYNVDNDPLFPNLSNAEGTTDLIDITSNGFKMRTTDATFNTNAGTYVYAAWAESPFQYSRAR